MRHYLKCTRYGFHMLIFFFNIYNLIKKNSPQELSVKTLIYRLHEYICSLIKPQKYIRIYNAVSYDPTWMNGLRLLVVVFIEIFNFWIHTIGWLDHGLVFLQGFLVFDLFLNTSFFLLPFTNDDTQNINYMIIREKNYRKLNRKLLLIRI